MLDIHERYRVYQRFQCNYTISIGMNYFTLLSPVIVRVLFRSVLC